MCGHIKEASPYSILFYPIIFYYDIITNVLQLCSFFSSIQMKFQSFFLGHVLCKVVILNVMVLKKSSFGGYYDSDKLFCLNSSLPTDLYIHFLKYNILCTYMYLWSNKTFFIVIVIKGALYYNLINKHHGKDIVHCDEQEVSLKGH